SHLRSARTAVSLTGSTGPRSTRGAGPFSIEARSLSIQAVSAGSLVRPRAAFSASAASLPIFRSSSAARPCSAKSSLESFPMSSWILARFASSGDCAGEPTPPAGDGATRSSRHEKTAQKVSPPISSAAAKPIRPPEEGAWGAGASSRRRKFRHASSTRSGVSGSAQRPTIRATLRSRTFSEDSFVMDVSFVQLPAERLAGAPQAGLDGVFAFRSRLRDRLHRFLLQVAGHQEVQVFPGQRLERHADARAQLLALQDVPRNFLDVHPAQRPRDPVGVAPDLPSAEEVPDAVPG